MKYTPSILLMSTISLVMAASSDNPTMPACMTTCTTSFSSNHDGSRCTTSWIDQISTCINNACSTDPTSTEIATDITVTPSMTFIPKMQYACLQSHLPGYDNEPPSPALVVSENDCTESPFGFLSFLPMYTDRSALQMCTLQLFASKECAGAPSNMTVDQDALSGVCSFKSGRSVRLVCRKPVQTESDNAAAHAYLSWLCADTGSGTSSTLAPATTVIPANSSVAACPAAGNSTCSPAFSNATATMSLALMTPTAQSSTLETGWSRAGRVVGCNGVAQWALVGVVFVGVLLL